MARRDESALYKPRPLRVTAFGVDDPLAKLIDSEQVRYLRRYLAALGATSVLEEPFYFDRDLLSPLVTRWSPTGLGGKSGGNEKQTLMGRLFTGAGRGS